MISLERGFWSKQRVLITGNTGFKGSWMSVILCELGAEVFGYSLPPDTVRSMYQSLNLSQLVEQKLADIRDVETFSKCLADWKPTILIHMAAQPIVSTGYQSPIDTFDVNIMGTAKVLEAARECSALAGCLVISSDKCYLNEDAQEPFKVGDPLGGKDPYSASKAGTEIVTHSYRQSFFSDEESANVASARAGNVIGGGDWAKDRLVPDAIRGFTEAGQLSIRNPLATRPWQHVLEPVIGYLFLIERLVGAPSFACEWNFGPRQENVVPVSVLAEKLCAQWGGSAKVIISEDTQDWVEAQTLALECSRTEDLLGYYPILDLDTTVEFSVDWYKAALFNLPSLWEVTKSQIDIFFAQAGRAR